MKTIFKLNNNLYFEGLFYLRSRVNTNWANPINSPTIFEAYGKGIQSGNWRSCTAINAVDYIIKNYLGGNITNI